MSRRGQQVIEATRFLEESDSECFCCGNNMFETDGFCRSCHIPIEVSKSAESRGTKPNFVPILGASGAGKTVYIGMLLDLLSKGAGGVCGLPSNAFTVAVQQQTIAALERRKFPGKTACEAGEWQWVHCEVAMGKKNTKHHLDIVTPDLAGESVEMELDHPDSFPAVRTCVSNASAVIILVDALRARDGGSEEDLFATKLATYIHEHVAKSGSGQKKVKIPVAVTFTKSDLCPEAAQEPSTFAKHNLPSLVAYSQRYFAKLEFFAASARRRSGEPDRRPRDAASSAAYSAEGNHRSTNVGDSALPLIRSKTASGQENAS